MIIRTRHAGAREVRSAEWGSSAIPSPGQGLRAYSGRAVTMRAAMGLPAVSAAIRLVAETIGALPIIVRDGNRRAVNAPQYLLLHDRPNELPQSPFEFVCQIASSIEASGNAFIHKVKGADGRVSELYVLDPDAVRVRRDAESGEKLFDVLVNEERLMGLTSSDIIHIPGFAPAGSLIGLSPIAMHRHALGNNLALQEFLGRYWANDASPGLVIKVPGTVGAQQAQQILATWASNHGGLSQSHKPAVLAGGAELEKIPISMKDAAYVEQTRLGIEDVANIFRIPKHMLGAGEPVGSTAEQESIRFLLYSLLPRIRRIEQGLAADDDLFGGTNLKPEILVDGLLRADAETRYNNALKARQGGILTANELRALEGYPPLPGGDELQMTPVGGAPNQTGGADAAA